LEKRLALGETKARVALPLDLAMDRRVIKTSRLGSVALR
jgi:hypothetical protein